MNNNGMITNGLLHDYCVLDLETTGKNPRFAQILEIAIIKIRNGEKVDEYCTLVNPGCSIPEETTSINGIRYDMVKDKPSFSSIADDVMDFIENDILLGYNIGSFDIPILLKEIFRAKKKRWNIDI